MWGLEHRLNKSPVGSWAYAEGLSSLRLCRKHQQDGEMDTLPGFINVNCDCCMFSDNPQQFKLK